MRKVISIPTIVGLILFLGACGDSEPSEKVFEMEEDGVTVKMTFKYEDDKVIEQTADNVLQYSAIGLSSKEEAEEFFDGQAEEFQGVDGITQEMEYKDDEMTETLKIVYDEVDYDEVKDLPGAMFEGDIDEGISMEETGKMLEEQGFEEK